MKIAETMNVHARTFTWVSQFRAAGGFAAGGIDAAV
jgi:hypothetical protein